MKNNIIIISHRGDRREFAENTIEAVQKHIDDGADAIEIDVRECGSGELVLFHDFSLNRMFQKSGYIDHVSLKNLLNHNYFHAKSPGQKIITLNEFFEHFKNKYPINIDAKTVHFFDFNFADKLISVIKMHNLLDSVWISCFNPFLLQILKIKDKRVQTGYLFQRTPLIHTTYDFSVFTNAWHPRADILNEKLITMAKNRNKKIFTWTVNDKKFLDKISQYPIDGIITDDVKMVKKVLYRQAQ